MSNATNEALVGRRLIELARSRHNAIWIQDWHPEAHHLSELLRKLEVPHVTFKIHGPQRGSLKSPDHLEFLLNRESNGISASLLVDRCQLTQG